MDTLLFLTGLVALETSYLTYRTLVPATQQRKRSILVDTSSLIDGRIVDVARSGFVSARFIIPRSVTRELQLLADKADADKRERARFGLDVVQTLQQIDQIEVEIYDDGTGHPDGVDEQLIHLAKKLHATICTTDYNLNKVARVESVQVANVNELAHAMRPQYLPGERLRVQIAQPGQNAGQGVGYLDDGTMVVVDQAKPHMGKVIDVEAIRMLQTEAGRMLFAKQLGAQTHASPKSQKPNQQNRQISHKHSSDKPRQAAAERTVNQQTSATSARRPQRNATQRRKLTPEDKLVNLVNDQNK